MLCLLDSTILCDSIENVKRACFSIENKRKDGDNKTSPRKVESMEEKIKEIEKLERIKCLIVDSRGQIGKLNVTTWEELGLCLEEAEKINGTIRHRWKYIFIENNDFVIKNYEDLYVMAWGLPHEPEYKLK